MANALLTLASAAARWLPAPLKRGLYQLGPLSRSLRAALNRSAPAGLVETKVAAGGLAGATLLLDLHTEKDYWLGTYEMDLQQAIRDWAKPGMVAFDLGANAGYISLMLARQLGPKGMVMAFEPLPANQERLRANLNLNPNLVVNLVPKAVAEHSGAHIFQVHTSDDMGKLQGSAGRQADYSGSIQVEAICLDDFVYKDKHSPPDLVKMDIEGGEVLALAGMKKMLNEKRPLLFIELHGPEAAREIWRLLQKANYSLHLLTKGYARIQDVDAFEWKSYVLGRPAA
ncbi:MAG: FkbM family methyltransferase [Anaerolineales bacterium]